MALAAATLGADPRVAGFRNDPGPTYNWFDFNFDTDPQQAGTMRRILDAVDPDLSDLRRQRGKLILYHGSADGLITPLRTIEYYEKVLAENRSCARTERFARLFLVPGMDHCGAVGGGLKTWDRLEPLVKWVEQGVAPDRIVASQALSGGAVRTGPLCPYPRQAKWNGNGSSDEAANFSCEMPRRGPHGHYGDDDDRDDHGERD